MWKDISTELKTDLNQKKIDAVRIYNETKNKSPAFQKEYAELQKAFSNAEKAVKSNTKTWLEQLKKTMDEEFMDVKKFDKSAWNIDSERKKVLWLELKAKKILNELNADFRSDDKAMNEIANLKSEFYKDFNWMQWTTLEKLKLKYKKLNTTLSKISWYRTKKVQEKKDIEYSKKPSDKIKKEFDTTFSKLIKKYSWSETLLRRLYDLKTEFNLNYNKLSNEKDISKIKQYQISLWKTLGSLKNLDENASISKLDNKSKIDDIRDKIISLDKDVKMIYSNLKDKVKNEDKAELVSIYNNFYLTFEKEKIESVEDAENKLNKLKYKKNILQNFSNDFFNEKNVLSSKKEQIIDLAKRVQNYFKDKEWTFWKLDINIKNKLNSLKLDFDRYYTYAKIENLTDANNKFNNMLDIFNEIKQSESSIQEKWNKSWLVERYEVYTENTASEQLLKTKYWDSIIDKWFSELNWNYYLLNYLDWKWNYVTTLHDFSMQVWIKNVENLNGKWLFSYLNYFRNRRKDENPLLKFSWSFKSVQWVVGNIIKRIEKNKDFTQKDKTEFTSYLKEKVLDLELVKNQYFTKDGSINLNITTNNIDWNKKVLDNNINITIWWKDFSNFTKNEQVKSLSVTAERDWVDIYKWILETLNKNFPWHENDFKIFVDNLSEYTRQGKDTTQLVAQLREKFWKKAANVVNEEVIKATKEIRTDIKKSSKDIDKLKSIKKDLETRIIKAKKSNNLDKDLIKSLEAELLTVEKNIKELEKKNKENENNISIVKPLVTSTKIVSLATDKLNKNLSTGNPQTVAKTKLEIIKDNEKQFTSYDIATTINYSKPYLSKEDTNYLTNLKVEKQKEEKIKWIEIDVKLDKYEAKVYNNILTPWEKTVWNTKINLEKNNWTWSYTCNFWNKKVKSNLNENEYKLILNNDEQWLKNLLALQNTLQECWLWKLWNYRSDLIKTFDNKITKIYNQTWTIPKDYFDDFIWKILTSKVFIKDLNNNEVKIKSMINSWNNPIQMVKNYLKENSVYSKLNNRWETTLEETFRINFVNVSTWEFKANLFEQNLVTV